MSNTHDIDSKIFDLFYEISLVEMSLTLGDDDAVHPILEKNLIAALKDAYAEGRKAEQSALSQKFLFPDMGEDEPFFVLRGRDYLFVSIIEAWALLRSGRVSMGKRALDHVYARAAQIEAQSSNDPQILSAFAKAEEGRQFQKAQALKPNPIVADR